MLLAAAPPALAEAAQPAASGYVPTTADYLGVYDALQRYSDANRLLSVEDVGVVFDVEIESGVRQLPPQYI